MVRGDKGHLPGMPQYHLQQRPCAELAQRPCNDDGLAPRNRDQPEQVLLQDSCALGIVRGIEDQRAVRDVARERARPWLSIS